MYNFVILEIEHGTEKTLWFNKLATSSANNNSETPMHIFNGNYWEQKALKDWSMCPKIFNK